MGILANSASKTMTSSSSDAVSDGYVTHERVVLTTSTTGSTYQWGMSAPMGSALSRSELSSYTVASPTFVPDVPGLYTLSCLIDDSTQYVLRVSATAAAFSHLAQAIRLTPQHDASVPTPASGQVLYVSIEQAGLTLKLPDGSLRTVDTTAVP